MKYQPYPRYKPSGVEWLGKVPEHWNVKPLGRFVRFRSGATPDKSKPEYWDGEIPWVSPKDMKERRITDVPDHISQEAFDNTPLTLLPIKSILIVVRGMILAHSFPVAITDAPVTINQDMRALTTGHEMEADFLLWLLVGASRAFVSLADESAHGTRKLASEIVAKVRLVVPPVHEQHVITNFLDHETAKIDRLMTKKRTLIERLKEKRTALISRTVTRGLPPDAARAVDLDPHPKLNASGIVWLGDVPEHWAPKRLRFIATHITVGIVVEPSKYYEESGVPCLRSLNVQPNKLIDRDLVYISPDSHRMLSKSMVKKGDLVAVRSGQPGTTAVIDDRFDSANCIDLIIVRKPRDGNSTFISYFLNSLPAQAQFTGGSGGAIQQHFNIATAADLWLIEPPPGEQDAVAVFLDRETARIDNLVAKIETAIDRLQEYRTALITAAVTGKIDVRVRTRAA